MKKGRAAAVMRREALKDDAGETEQSENGQNGAPAKPCQAAEGAAPMRQNETDQRDGALAFKAPEHELNTMQIRATSWFRSER